jgi:hypothetical protein
VAAFFFFDWHAQEIEACLLPRTVATCNIDNDDSLYHVASVVVSAVHAMIETTSALRKTQVKQNQQNVCGGKMFSV